MHKSQMDTEKANKELNWVIRMVYSVKTKTQLEVALRCFFLWDLKHVTSIYDKTQKSAMKSKFWSIYKNKETQFSLSAT